LESLEERTLLSGTRVFHLIEVLPQIREIAAIARIVNLPTVSGSAIPVDRAVAETQTSAQRDSTALAGAVISVGMQNPTKLVRDTIAGASVDQVPEHEVNVLSNVATKLATASATPIQVTSTVAGLPPSSESAPIQFPADDRWAVQPLDRKVHGTASPVPVHGWSATSADQVVSEAPSTDGSAGSHEDQRQAMLMANVVALDFGGSASEATRSDKPYTDDGLAESQAVDLAALERQIRECLNQLAALRMEWSDQLSRIGLLPWVAMTASAFLLYETARRARAGRNRQLAFAMAGKGSIPLWWFPGLFS
jgi:hypothetical protein